MQRVHFVSPSADPLFELGAGADPGRRFGVRAHREGQRWQHRRQGDPADAEHGYHTGPQSAEFGGNSQAGMEAACVDFILDRLQLAAAAARVRPEAPRLMMDDLRDEERDVG